MFINTEKWITNIGTFSGCKQKNLLWPNHFFNSFLSILVLKTGDIKLNFEPNKKSHSYFSYCCWQLLQRWRPTILFINMILYVLFLIPHLRQRSHQRGVTKVNKVKCHKTFLNFWLCSLWQCGKTSHQYFSDYLCVWIGYYSYVKTERRTLICFPIFWALQQLRFPVIKHWGYSCISIT